MRNLSLDYLKMLLACSVVLLHTHFLAKIYPVLSFVLVNGLFRLAVPLFLIITGYYFSQVNTSAKFKAWLIRLSTLYVIWMLIYSYIWYTYYTKQEIIITLFTGYFILWYIMGVLLAGIILFYLRKLKSAYLFALIVVLYLIGYVAQELGNLHWFSGQTDEFLNTIYYYRNFLLDCFPFLTLGYLIQREKLTTRIHVKLSWLLVSIALLLLESYLNYRFIHPKEALDLLMMLFVASPLIFIYVKDLPLYGNSKIFSQLSSAIFFVHPLFLFLYARYQLTMPIELFTLVTSAVAGYFLVLLNKKVKYLL